MFIPGITVEKLTEHIHIAAPSSVARAMVLLPLMYLLPSVPSASEPASPVFEDCFIGNTASQLAADCTTVLVPLDPELPDGEKLELAVARLSATGNDPQADPLTLIAGGPGQAARDAFAAVAGAFRTAQVDRDILLIDQRGTGASHPLSCAQETPADAFDIDLGAIEDNARSCLESLDIDPRLFTTSVAVHDLDAVRSALGIDVWNLYGVSYGTRVALHYLRRYPTRVRSLIVDAVVPPDLPLGPDIAFMAQRSLDGLFARCRADGDCHAAFETIEADTHTLLDRLKRQPETVRFEDLRSGRLKSLSLTHRHLAVTLRLMSYSSHGMSLLPSMLHEAVHNDNLAPFARQADMQLEELGSSLATGMHNAVVCTEDVPFIAEDFDAASLDNTYLGSELLDVLRAGCVAWPAGRIDADFHEPLQSDVPTLILSGTADPITPDPYGDRISAGLEQSRHIANPHQGHMQAPLGCVPTIMAQFVRSANSDSLETDCLDRLQPPPFFVDPNGPMP